MLTIQNLSYSHPNKNTLFTNLSMTVNQSDKIALLAIMALENPLC